MKFALAAIALSCAFSITLNSEAASQHRHAPDVVDGPQATELVPVAPQWGIRTEEEVEEFMTEARDSAQGFMRKAEKNSNDEDEIASLRKLRSGLDKAKIAVPPPDSDFRPCLRKGVIAYVKRAFDGNIYVCHRTAYIWPSSQKVAQSLVHESAHIMGLHDECDATEMEVNVMRKSGVGLIFKNGYMDDCGIE